MTYVNGISKRYAILSLIIINTLLRRIIMKCPGQDMKYWKDDAIFEVSCPQCGKAIEFYKDDTTRKCGHCDHRLVNPKMDFGCASYCQFAEQCMGTLPEEFMGSREDLLKDKVAVAMKRFYQSDFTSIRKATNAARHAENIGKAEGANLAVILCAVYLHGMAAENTSSILAAVGASKPLIEEITRILESLNNSADDVPAAAQIVEDAIMLEKLQDDLKKERIAGAAARQLAEQQLFTESARNIAADSLQ